MDLGTVLGSATAGLFGRLLCHPIDTCKAQIQLMKSSQRASVSGVFTNVMKTEGIAGLYRGIGAALLGGMPAVCLYLSSYEV